MSACDECDRLGRAVVHAERFAVWQRVRMVACEGVTGMSGRVVDGGILELAAATQRLADARLAQVSALDALRFHEADAHG